jgi:O-antigen/teichoic acid export membrane protein
MPALINALSLQSVSVVIRAILQLLTMMVLARYLTPSEFGLVALANLTIMLLQMLSEAGVSSVLIQRDVISKQMIAASLHISIVIGCLFLFPLIAFAEAISIFFEMNDLEDLLKVLSIGFLLIAFYKIPESLLQREMKFRPLLIIDLLASVFAYSIPAIILAINGFGALSVVLASVFQLFLKAVILGFYKPSPFFYRYSVTQVKDILSFGSGVTLNRICNYAYRNVDKVLIGKIFGQETLGIYHVAIQLIIMPVSYIGDVLTAVFFPFLSRLKLDRAVFYSVETIILKVSFYIVSFLGLIFYFYADLVVNLIYGPGWEKANIIVSILGLGLGFRILTRISDVINRAAGQIFSSAMLKLFISLILLAAVYMATYIDLEAVAISVVLVSLLSAFLLMKLAFDFTDDSFLLFVVDIKWTILTLFGFYLSFFAADKILTIPSDSLENLFLIIPLSLLASMMGFFLYRADLKFMFKKTKA